MLGQEEKSRQLYPRQLKIRVAEEVVSGVKGPSEISRDYGIHINVINRWVKKYRNQIFNKETKEELPLYSMVKKKDNTESDLEKKVKSLEEENMHLRKKLMHSDLRGEALDKLIEIAERTYGISVLKNSGAKQSKR
jgi:transposase-like protein